MTIIEKLEELEAAARGNARLEVLKKNDSVLMRDVLTMALSPQITFGVKKLPKYEDKQNEFGDDSFYTALSRLLRSLQTRELTGNEAQEAIATFLAYCNPTEAKWAQRIIKQDLRLDLGVKDVNNTLGEGTIFQFSVPLAEDYAKVDDKHFGGRWAVEPKLDGARCVAFLPANKGRVTLFSRSGKEYNNFESVRLKLQEINDARPSIQDLVLDGEVVSYVNEKIDFQALQHTLFRKDGVEVGKLRYLVFDGAVKSEWEKSQKTYGERYKFLESFIAEYTNAIPGVVSKVGLVPMFVTVDPDRARMLSYSKTFVEAGYEGAMFRRVDEPVLLKRSRALLKVKSFFDAEATLVDMVPGTGKYDGILGALRCKTQAGKEFEIGSGFTDEQRRAYWRSKGNLPTTVTFKYQELTDDGIPRFPIFKGFRDSKDL